MKQATEDAATFLSATTVLIGIFVTIVATTIVQLFAQKRPAPIPVTFSAEGFRNLALIALLVVDLAGVGLPFTALYLNTVGPISTGLVKSVYISTVAVVAINVFFPILLARFFVSYKDLTRWAGLQTMALPEQLGYMRSILVDEGYMRARSFDEIADAAVEYDVVKGEAAREYLSALFRAIILGRPGWYGRTFYRTVTYYMLYPIVMTVAKRGELVMRPHLTASALAGNEEESERR